MKTAKFIKEVSDMRGDARLYELSEPLENNKFVIVSLDGSFKGEQNHAKALENAGYQIV